MELVVNLAGEKLENKIHGVRLEFSQQSVLRYGILRYHGV